MHVNVWGVLLVEGSFPPWMYRGDHSLMCDASICSQILTTLHTHHLTATVWEKKKGLLLPDKTTYSIKKTVFLSYIEGMLSSHKQCIAVVLQERVNLCSPCCVCCVVCFWVQFQVCNASLMVLSSCIITDSNCKWQNSPLNKHIHTLELCDMTTHIMRQYKNACWFSNHTLYGNFFCHHLDNTLCSSTRLDARRKAAGRPHKSTWRRVNVTEDKPELEKDLDQQLSPKMGAILLLHGRGLGVKNGREKEWAKKNITI